MSEEIKNENPVPEVPKAVVPEIVTPPGVEIKEVNKKPEAAPIPPEQQARIDTLRKIQGVGKAIQQLLDQEGLALVVEHNIKVVPKNQ